MDEFRFGVMASALEQALDAIAVVVPRPCAKDAAGTQVSGYLFCVRRDRGYVYARDAVHVARADFAVDGGSGECAFVIPSRHLDALLLLARHDPAVFIEFVVQHEDTPGKRVAPVVRYTCGRSGAIIHCFDAALVAGCDQAFADATNPQRLPVSVLREALKLASSFHADPKNRNAQGTFHSVVEIVNASLAGCERGDGHLSASDGVRRLHFWSKAFEGGDLVIHASTVSLLREFLGRCEGEHVTMTTGPSTIFVADDAGTGAVLGWAKPVQRRGKFANFSLALDQTVVRVDRDDLVEALRYVRSASSDSGELPRRAVLVVEPGSILRVETKEVSSWDVPVDNVALDTGVPRVHVHIDHLLSLFETAKSDRVELRLHRLEQGGYIIRTREEFAIRSDGKVMGVCGAELPAGAHPCIVTRFTSSYG